MIIYSLNISQNEHKTVFATQLDVSRIVTTSSNFSARITKKANDFVFTFPWNVCEFHHGSEPVFSVAWRAFASRPSSSRPVMCVARAPGVLFFIRRGGDKGTPAFALHPPPVSTQVWAATSCQLAPRLLPSHPSINDLTYSKTNNGNFSLVFQSKHAMSAAPRPNQHQMSVFFFSSTIPLSCLERHIPDGISEIRRAIETLVTWWERERAFQTSVALFAHACMQNTSQMYHKHILAPARRRIKHLVPPCISAVRLFEAEHVSIRADSMHQLLPKRQQIGPSAHPEPSNTPPVDTHHSHRSFSQEGRLIYFSTSLQ